MSLSRTEIVSLSVAVVSALAASASAAFTGWQTLSLRDSLDVALNANLQAQQIETCTQFSAVATRDLRVEQYLLVMSTDFREIEGINAASLRERFITAFAENSDWFELDRIVERARMVLPETHHVEAFSATFVRFRHAASLWETFADDEFREEMIDDGVIPTREGLFDAFDDSVAAYRELVDYCRTLAFEGVS